MKNILLTVCLLWGGVLSAQLPLANPETIRKDLAVLTSDAFRGRGTADTGYNLAAAYVGEKLLEAGMHTLSGTQMPGGRPEDFFLPVPMLREKLIDIRWRTGSKSWKFGKDFYTNRAFPKEIIVADEIVVIGYGREEDVNQAVLADKVVVIWRKKTGKEKPASIREITRQLNRSNPRAIILIDQDFPKKPAAMAAFLQTERVSIDYNREIEEGISINTNPAVPMVVISEKTARKIWKDQGLEWKKSWAAFETPGSRRPQVMPFQMRLQAEMTSVQVNVPNVAGFLPGKKYPDQYIVVTAHLDHLGKHDGKTYYGADDNGSGSSALLEMTRLLQQYREQGELSDRSIVFLWFTGEEMGLLGSQYFTYKSVIPLENIMANLNVDMIGRIDKAHEQDTNYVYLIGSDRLSTQLHQKSEEINSNCCGMQLDYTFNDPKDKNRYYERSDHYNFAKQGIPCIFYFSGIHADYHKPTDTMDKINFHRIARITDLILQTAVGLGNLETPLLLDKQ